MIDLNVGYDSKQRHAASKALELVLVSEIKDDRECKTSLHERI